MRYLYFLIIFSFCWTCFSQESISKDLLEFEQLTISGKHNVTITQGQSFHITIESLHPDFQTDKVQFNYTGNKLAIHYDGGIIRDYLIEMTVVLPTVNYIEARNGAQITIDEDFIFDVSMLSLRVSIGGKISATTKNMPWLKALVQQSGTIQLKGTATLADLEVKTGGLIEAKNLKVQKANAKVNLGGDIQVNALEILHADIPSFGNIYYLGSPEVISNLGRRANLIALRDE